MTSGLAASACLLTAVFTGSATVSAQQDDALQISPGTYQGSLSFTGGFDIDIAEAAAQTGQNTSGVDISGILSFTSAINGPATLVATDAAVTGDWSFDGTGTTAGQFMGTLNGLTATIDIDGTSTYSAAGTFTGVPAAAQMTGTLDSTSTATVSTNLPGPFGGQSATTTDSQELVLTLTEPITDCTQVFARVDLEVRQSIEQIPGATATVQGNFFATTTEADELLFDEIEVLNDQISTLWNRISDANEVELSLIADAYELINQVEQFEDDLVDDECRANPDFANVMTMLTADLVDRLIAKAADSTNADLIERIFFVEAGLELGLRSGALGSGTKIRARAMRIAENAEAALGGLFQDATDAGGIFELEQISLLGRQYGWEFTNDAGVTSTDILLTLGVE